MKKNNREKRNNIENSESAEKKRRSLSALDVSVIIIALLCVAGVMVRIYAGDSGVLPISNPDKEEYVASFEISGVKTVLGTGISSGEKLYDENGSFVGTVGENVTITPAKLYVEDSEGKYIQIYASADNGDNSLIDIRGTVLTKGYYTDYGFLADGKTYIAPNYTIELHTDRATFTLRITDISKVEKIGDNG